MLFGLVILLLATPSSLFSPVTYIDTELNLASVHKVPVRTETDFGSPEVMASFPYDVGGWNGYDYETTAYVKRLGANVILLRGYLSKTAREELFLTIVQAKSESGIHDPAYCFRAQGYLVHEYDDTVSLSNPSWVRGTQPISIPVKKLVADKTSEDGKVVGRRVALHLYVKGNQFHSDTITMIQTETIAPIEDSYENSVSELKGFLTSSIPLMFSPGPQDNEWRPLALSLAERGMAGFIILGFLVIIPIGIAFYPVLKRKSK